MKNSLNIEEIKFLKKMKQDGFVIDDNFDEIEFLKLKYEKGKFSNSNNLKLTIAPTMICNFSCPYCYEKPDQQSFMSKEVIAAIKDMVSVSVNQKKNLHVTWYGGEPLLATDIIWDLSEYFIDICAKNNVNYSASIVTNGYLIDDKVINSFVKYKISSVQITIDGPPDIHNTRRRLKNISVPTFDIILNNAKKVLDAGIRLNIRINVDKSNVSRVNDLLDILSKNQMQDSSVSLGHVKDAAKSCEFSNALYLTTEEFAKEVLRADVKLLELGFNPKNYPLYPHLRSHSCGADSTNSKVIAPNGNMYKCWHDISDDLMCIGNVLKSKPETSTNIMNHLKYMMTSVFDKEKCLNCKVLPLCMGGCAALSSVSGERCVRWRYNLIDTLKAKLDYSQNRSADR